MTSGIPIMNRGLTTLLLYSACVILYPIQSGLAQTQEYNHQINNTNGIVARITATNFTPNNDGVPSGTVGGGSRSAGLCSANSTNHGASLVPIVAANAQNLTVAERPSLLVYITNTTVDQLFLNITDDQGSYDYQATVPISEGSGILKISLPDDAPPLLVGSTYQWSLAIICGESLRPDDPFVRGYIQRVEFPAISQDVLLETIAGYAHHGIWYDTISNLADARQADPDDAELLLHWMTLLSAVGFEELVSAPLLF